MAGQKLRHLAKPRSFGCCHAVLRCLLTTMPAGEPAEGFSPLRLMQL